MQEKRGPDSHRGVEAHANTEKMKTQAAVNCKRHRVEDLEGHEEPTKERYRKAVAQINKLDSVDDTLALAERSHDAKSVLHSQMADCDCHA